MSLLRRRMMMQAAESEAIPRERLVFSHAGDVILTDVTKKNDGAVICGVAIIHQTYYPSPYGPYWLHLILMTKNGRNDDAILANKWTRNVYCYKVYKTDGYVHSIPSTNWNSPEFDSLQDGIDFVQSINVNNLPIMNLLTKKEYKGTWDAGGSFHCEEAATDLLEYYYGVI